MKKMLSKKEFLFLTEFRNILLKYDALLQWGENGNLEVLVFEGKPEQNEDPALIEFPRFADETDIDAFLFRRNREAAISLRMEIGISIFG